MLFCNCKLLEPLRPFHSSRDRTADGGNRQVGGYASRLATDDDLRFRETGFPRAETDRPKSPSGQKWSPRRRKRSRKSPPRVASVLRDYGLNERAEAPADSKALHDEGGVTW